LQEEEIVADLRSTYSMVTTLVSLFEKYELGLKPKTVYELVPEFFRSFES
jgi:hypothetical protein